MHSADINQRTIILGSFEEKWQANERQEEFQEALQRIIEGFGLQGVTCHFDSQTDRQQGHVTVFAKVTWPAGQPGVKRTGIMELHDALDEFNVVEQLPPL